MIEHGAVPLVQRHGDFGGSNILIAPSNAGVTVLDLAASEPWGRWDDVVYFLASLKGLILARPASWGSFAVARAAFLEGYGQREPTIDDPMYRLSVIAVCLRIADDHHILSGSGRVLDAVARAALIRALVVAQLERAVEAQGDS
jgi:hypothetical protein